MTTVQKTVYLEDIAIPVIYEEKHTYYPVSFIEKHVLLREKGSFAAGVKAVNKVKFKIDFTQWGGGIQTANCLSEATLIERLKRTQTRRFRDDQINQQNKLHRYLKITELETSEFEWNYYDINWLKELDNHSSKIVERFIELNEDMKSRKCKDCNRIFPLADKFFYRETNNRELFSNSCILCRSKSKRFASDDGYENYLTRVNPELLPLYLQKDYLGLYEEYKNKSINKLPEEACTKEFLKMLVMSLYEKKLIDESNLTRTMLKKNFRLDINKFEKTSITELYQWLYGDLFYLEKWLYPRYAFSSKIKLTRELASEIFNGYLLCYGIEIDNPSEFDYYKIINACGLTGSLGTLFSGLGEFFVFYWNGKHAGYEFRELGNYYRTNDNNLLFDFKYLVEKDMKIEIGKIPLYVTKGLLHRNYRNIYNFMRSDGRSLYYWFDILYPDKFIETDFTIGRYRNEFDSIEEQQVDDVLREYFNNVVYNYNSSEQVVELKGKRPDWFIMTEKGIWLVEYFGMYIEKQKYNPIIASYIKTTHEKIDLYNEMSGYNFLFVYPTDLDKGFFGLRDKLKKLKINVD